MPSPADKAEDLHSRFTPDYTPEQLENLGVYDALYRGQAPRLASLGAWKPEWISEHDPKGWAQWYKRYAAGRRIPGEDERQIQRWLNFKSRHGGPFSKKPTPRRGWALRNWGIDPSKLVPDQAQNINELLDEHQRKAMQKFVQEKVAEEKQAISAKLVHRTAMRGMEGIAKGTVTPERMQRFVGTASRWLPGAEVRNMVQGLTAAAGQKVPAALKGALPVFQAKRALPASVQRAFLSQPVARAANLGAEAVPTATSALRDAISGVARGSTGELRGLLPGGLGVAFSRGTNTVSGVGLGKPSSLFHELGHGLDHAVGAMGGRSTIGQEIMAWRRGSQMYDTWRRALPAAQQVGLPTQKQFLASRKGALNSYRFGDLKDYLGNAPGFIQHVASNPAVYSAAAKTAALSPDVSLQEHQQRVADRVSREDPRLLVYHGLGSGKSLSAIAAAEAAQKAHGGSYGVVVPASLRGNFQKELSKFAPKSNPEILSYSGLALGKKFKQQPDTLIMDEAQRLRNPDSASAQAARDAAAKAKRLLLLSGTPITNSPSDMASLLSMLTNRELTPRQFEDRYVGYKSKFPGIIPWLRGAQWGEVPYVKNEKELRQLLQGRVDYQPSKTPEGVDVQEEQIRVPLSKAQQKIQKAIRTKIPPGFLWKLDQEFPMSREELAKMNSFMNGLRQISLSTQSFRGDKDPLKAFDQSSKLQTALENLQKSLASDKRKKALIYSNFVESGVNPYAAALTRAGIPHGVFHGGIPTEARQKALRDYNEGKLRALLIGPAGAEGISTKGTNLIQLLDPHWNESRIQQARGRGLRFDSHAGLPEDLKNVQVQRYLSSSEEPGLLGKLLGMRRQRTGDEVLENLAQNKEQLNAAFRKILQEAGTPETAQN